MKALWQDLRHHLQADFRLNLYVTVALWATLLLSINYYFDLEDSYIDSFQGKPLWSVLYFALYATAYYVSVWLWTYFHNRPDVWHTWELWLRSGCALICYSIYAVFYAHSEWSHQLFDGQIYVFSYYCLHNLQATLTIVLPLYLFYRFVDRQPSNFYGMAPKRKGLYHVCSASAVYTCSLPNRNAGSARSLIFTNKSLALTFICQR